VNVSRGFWWGILLLSGAACAAEDFHASVGPGVYSGPFFPGAQHSRRLVFPFIDAEYAGRLYTSATDLLGVYAYKTTDTQVGAAVTITPAESAVSRLPLFASRAGIADVHVNGLAEWVIHSKYRIGAQTWLGYLRGDALASPVVMRHEQTTVVGWIAYRFN
jgi:outer membrane scaffolding protein for murein synthesis (MipA/OmpV family)